MHSNQNGQMQSPNRVAHWANAQVCKKSCWTNSRSCDVEQQKKTLSESNWIQKNLLSLKSKTLLV